MVDADVAEGRARMKAKGEGWNLVNSDEQKQTANAIDHRQLRRFIQKINDIKNPLA